jgi:hypothetical protein
VAVFVGLAVFGYYKSFLVLALNIAAHGLDGTSGITAPPPTSPVGILSHVCW